MYNPVQVRVSTRRSTRDGTPLRCPNVSFNVEILKEGRVNISVGCSTAAKVHRVWAVESCTEGLGLYVSRVLYALELQTDSKVICNVPCTSRVP